MVLTQKPIPTASTPKEIGDFYWAHADILRGFGISSSSYDQRILAFMALKLLVDNDKLQFNFDYKNQFGLSDEQYAKYKANDIRDTFFNIINNLENLGKNLHYFQQEAKYNPDEKENILAYFNHTRTFNLTRYIKEELPESSYLEKILDIYNEKANFKGYPKEKYKDLYEKTIARMKDLKGDLTGQHFTQKSVIHLMCEVALKNIKKTDHIAIYDPACGTGSMIMESAAYFHHKKKGKSIEVFGQEYHGQTWLLAKIFLEISSLDGGKTQGIQNTIAYGNTLTDPAFARGINGQDSFDFIIANPPFGVDWKHDKEKVMANMELGEESHFVVVKNDKNKVVRPKISDGQFLFMMHIVKLMEREKAKNKRALAAIISSSTLISTGTNTSSEAKIRKAIFGRKIVKAVVSQPEAMFTNTTIGSHIWFLDTQTSDCIKVIRTDNEEEPLFSPHPAPQDKMKNSYSEENIQRIHKLLTLKKEVEYVSKNILKPEDRCEISIRTEVGFKEVVEKMDLQLLQQELEAAQKELLKYMAKSPVLQPVFLEIAAELQNKTEATKI